MAAEDDNALSLNPDIRAWFGALPQSNGTVDCSTGRIELGDMGADILNAMLANGDNDSGRAA